MRRRRYLLDTNAVVALLRGERWCARLVDGADWIGVSAVSEVELEAWPGLTKRDRSCLREFLRRVDVVSMSCVPTRKVAGLRLRYGLDFEDALVVETALACSAALVTADQALRAVRKLKVIGPPTTA
jgi:hypothetical protein